MGSGSDTLPSMNKPRKPGSQVAPGLKALYTDRKTASKHSKVPIAQATAGKLYRVRDKDWVVLWGENLSWAAANELWNLVVARKRSRTVRVEDMDVAAPEGVVVPPITALGLGGPTARVARPPHSDTTVRAEAPRKAPPPRDSTVPGYRQIDPLPERHRPVTQRHNFIPVGGGIVTFNSMLCDPSNNPQGVVSGEIDTVQQDMPEASPVLDQWPDSKEPPPPADLRELYADLGTVTEDDIEHAESEHGAS